MLASAGTYPPLLQHLRDCGPLMQSLLLLLAAAFLFGMFRLWRAPQLSTRAVILILAPTLIACALAGYQSLLAEIVIHINEGGMGYLARPDRYIGYVRIFLAAGVAMSLALLCVAHFSRQTPKERNA